MKKFAFILITVIVLFIPVNLFNGSGSFKFTPMPTVTATITPTATPTAVPTVIPTAKPTIIPTVTPTPLQLIGNTYIEINVKKQHLKFYKNGVVILEGDIVSGCVSWGTETPKGTFQIYSKEPARLLEGYDYSVFVNFWMPFYEGYGIHDANWRTTEEFGGTTYFTNGSHGCINCPYWLAEAIWNNAELWTYVIVI